jgi:hypothetical protein
VASHFSDYALEGFWQIPRRGNVHTADGWKGVLKPVVKRYQGTFLNRKGPF